MELEGADARPCGAGDRPAVVYDAAAEQRRQLGELRDAGLDELGQTWPKYQVSRSDRGTELDLTAEVPLAGAGAPVERVYYVREEGTGKGFSVATTLHVAPGWPDNLVVFSPGLGCTQESFADVAAAAAKAGHSVLRLDWPGHGKTSELNPAGADAHAWSLRGCAASLVGILNTFGQDGVKDVTLVGHSMGGSINWLAAASPELKPALRAAIGVEPRTYRDCERSKDVAELDGPGFEEMLSTIETGEDSARQTWATWIRQGALAVVPALSRDLVALTGSDAHETRAGDSLFTIVQALGDKAVYMRGGNTKAPGWTEHTTLPGWAAADDTVIADSGHFPMLDQPETFAAAVCRLLSAARRKPAADHAP